MGVRAGRTTRIVSLVLSLAMLVGLCEPSAFQALVDVAKADSGYSFVFGTGSSSLSVPYGGYATGNISGILPEHQGLPILEVTISREENMLLEPENGRDKFQQKTGSMQYGEGSTDRGGTSFLMFSPYMWQEMQDQVSEHPDRSIGIGWYQDGVNGHDSLQIKDISAMGGRLVSKRELSSKPYVYDNGIFYDFIIESIAANRKVTPAELKADLGSIKQSEIEEVVIGSAAGTDASKYNWRNWVDLSQQGNGGYYESAILLWSYILENTAGTESAASAGYSNPKVDYTQLGSRLEGFLGFDQNFSMYPKLKAVGGTNALQKWYDDPTAANEHVMYRLKMLDLLLSCYIIIGGSEENMRKYFDSIGNTAGYATMLGVERMANAVNDWTKNQNLDKAPIGINVSTWVPAIIGSGVQYPINSEFEPYNGRTKCNIVLVRTTSWMDFTYQVPKEYRFNLPQGSNGWAYKDFVELKDGDKPLGTHKRYLWVINKTAEKYPQKAEVAPAATWNKTDAFSWARSLISYGGIVSTLSGNAYCRTEKSKWGYLSFLAPFNDTLQVVSSGSPGVFGNVYMATANPPLTASELVIELDAHFEDGSTTKTLVGDGPELGEPVYLEVNGAKSVDLDTMWKPYYLSNEIEDFKVWFEWGREQAPNSPGPVATLKGSGDIEGEHHIKQGTPVNKLVWHKGTSGELAQFVGTSRAPTRTKDMAAAQDILVPEGESRAWVYSVQMFIEYTSGGKTFQVKSNVARCNVGVELDNRPDPGAGQDQADEESVPLVIKREKKPEVRMWNSYPKTYSELKEGTVGNETFEAMAGVPSTETLYFASGGSEFIVDIEAVRIEGATAKRQYRSYFDQVDCEYKEPDTAKPQTLGGVSVQLHEGGHYTASKTWSGKCGYSGSTGGHGSTVLTETMDHSPYENAVKEAEAYAKEINDTVLSYMSGSDKLNREHKGWSAHVVTVHTPHPGSSGSCHGYGEKGNHLGDTAAKVGSACDYKVWVEFDVPHDIICGPCCHHVLPSVQDTWEQNIRFDYMKITDLHVWKIDQSAVDGMSIITDAGDEIVQAKIVKGEPNVFYNIAETDTSKDGRLRYNLEAQQHDSVVWHETGVNSGNQRTNKCNGVVSHRSNEEPVQKNGHDNPWGVGILYSNGSNPTRNDNNPDGKAWCHDYIDKLATSKNTAINAVQPDAVDSATAEYKRFMERRNYMVQARVISDMLILQTSSGDQSVLYYDKPSTVVAADQNFNRYDSDGEENRVKTEIEDLWDRNKNCAGLGFQEGVTQGRDAVEWINYGSYNGKYNEPANKYKGSGDKAKIETAFDSNGSLWDATTAANAKPNYSTVQPLNYRASTIKETGGNVTASPTDEQKRLDRPRSELRLYKDKIVQNVTNPNQEYITGDAEVYWKNIVDYHTANYKNYGSRNNTTDALYDTSYKRLYTGTGYTQESPYSPEHNKINDIVVQDPVSVEKAYVVGLPDERDQRATLPNGVAEYTNQNTNKNTTCPGDPASCEFRILNCKFYQDQVVGSFNFQDSMTNAVGEGKTYTPTSGFSISSNKLVASNGRRTSIPFSDMGLSYSPGTKLQVSLDYTLSGGVSTMLMGFQNIGVYLVGGSTIQIVRCEGGATKILASAARTLTGTHHLDVVFDMRSIEGFTVKLDGAVVGMSVTTPYTNFSSNDYGSTFNIGCWNATNDYYASFEMDNLVITRLAGTKYHTESCYNSVAYHPSGNNTHVHTKECLHATNEGGGGGSSANVKKDFVYTGNIQSFTAPANGTYKLEVWGAQGATYTAGREGGLGGYSYGEVDLKKGQTIYVAVGGQGVGATGGFNGGASTSEGGAGGGATHISTVASQLSGLNGNRNSVFIVAGGGGGSYCGNTGASGGGTSGGNGTSVTSGYGYGGTQSSGAAFGAGSSGYRHGGGGGGGWFGGYGGYDCSGGGGGGSGYIGGVKNGSTTGGKQSGNGKAAITLIKTVNDNLSGLDAVIDAMNGGAKETPTNTVVYDKGYSGNVEAVTLQPGVYKMEVWGAQGGDGFTGDSTGWSAGSGGRTGGKGAYAVGTYKVEVPTTVYVGVGGRGNGSTNQSNYNPGATSVYGGFNGGGNGNYWYGYQYNYLRQQSGGGGGATHIATQSGTLPTLSGSTSSVLIVAGGGGGASGTYEGSAGTTSGSTTTYRGAQGNNGANVAYVNGGEKAYSRNITAINSSAYGGSTGVGNDGGNGVFGQGGNGGNTSPYASSGNYSMWGDMQAGGGGGGWFGGGGGGAGYISNNGNAQVLYYTAGGGGGGSSYIGGVKTDKGVSATMIGGTSYMTLPNGSKGYGQTGDGYARITQLTSITGGNSGAGGVVAGNPIDFKMTSKVESMTLPAGTYKLEVWGAQGGSYTGQSQSPVRGLGGYSSGTVTFNQPTTVYVAVGGAGMDGVDSAQAVGGYNGGGSATYTGGNSGTAGGGGATHIATADGLLRNLSGNRSSVLIVAGGAGGLEHSQTNGYGGAGGGTNGQAGYQSGMGGQGAGGTQSTGYAFGQGGSTATQHSAGGGGGWYGGYAGSGDNTNGGGGSGYIGGVTGGVTYDGTQSFPSPTGGSERGHSGHGYARITPIDVKSAPSLTEEQLEQIFGKDVWQQIKNQATSGGGAGANSKSFAYTGNYQAFTAPVSGTYTLEVWGAQGGTGGQASGGVRGIGGKGGYSSGKYNLTAGQTVYVYVGGKGADSWLKDNGYVGGTWNGGTKQNAGGWNGGGYSYNFGAGGGGATDIRTVSGAWSNTAGLNSRIIVAGGGGGAQAADGGAGGGLTGGDGTSRCGHVGKGGTQSQGGQGAVGFNMAAGVSGSFGTGGIGQNGNGSFDNQFGAGGGGGWYGGGGSSSDVSNTDDSGAGGGSSYIAKLTEGKTTPGLQSGNGKAKISWESAEYDADKIWDIVVKNLTKIPEKLPDGSPNPILVCGDAIANGSAIGTMTDASFGGGTSKVSTKVGDREIESIKLNKNTTGAVTLNSVKTAPGEYYVVLFDVKSSESMSDFKVSFGGKTTTLRANRGTVTKKWVVPATGNPTTLKFTGGGADMPGDVTITNIHVYKKSAYYNKHVCDAACYTKKELQCSEPHHSNTHYGVDSTICWEACMDDAKHRNYIPKDHVDLVDGKEIHPGEFLNLDYGFKVYYPNLGDFQDTLCHGIAATTTERGKGYVNNMDTTKWTREKRITFDFAVLYERFEGQWEQYRAGEAINLTVTGWSYPYYNFYVLLANNEHVAAPIQYEVEAINCAPANHKGDGGIDASKENKVYPYFSDGISNHGEAPTLTNRQRFGDLTALHSAWKQNVIDVVGRIGNLTAADTDDYRFSNFFKVPLASDDWIVEGIVKQVNQNIQNNFYGDRVDVRGEPVGVGTHWLNTYGVQEWKEESPVTFPIQGAKNNIMVLKKEQMRPGYNVYLDIATLGDYSRGELQVFPYFYVLDVHNGDIIPVDVYMNDNGEYSAVNVFGMADEDKGGETEVDPTEEFRYAVTLDWADEAGRRNYTDSEVRVTQDVANFMGEPIYGYYTDMFGEELYGIIGYNPSQTPSGTNYTEGDMQMLLVEDRGKTYLGTSDTYGAEINIWGKEAEVSFAKQGQRWHFKLGIPSSSVFVRYDGVEHLVPDVNNTNEFYDPLGENYAVLMCAEIYVRGETYILRAGYPDGNNGYIDFGDKRIKLPTSIPRCIAVMNSTYTATDDVDIVKTH